MHEVAMRLVHFFFHLMVQFAADHRQVLGCRVAMRRYNRVSGEFYP